MVKFIKVVSPNTSCKISYPGPQGQQAVIEKVHPDEKDARKEALRLWHSESVYPKVPIQDFTWIAR
jgi:hypothetical protein